MKDCFSQRSASSQAQSCSFNCITDECNSSNFKFVVDLSRWSLFEVSPYRPTKDQSASLYPLKFIFLTHHVQITKMLCLYASLGELGNDKQILPPSLVFDISQSRLPVCQSACEESSRPSCTHYRPDLEESYGLYSTTTSKCGLQRIEPLSWDTPKMFP